MVELRLITTFRRLSHGHHSGVENMVVVGITAGEFFMMALRKRRGFHISEFEQCFDTSLPETHQEVLHQFQQKGLLQEDAGRWSFTPEGVLLSNEVMGSLVGIESNWL